MQSLGCRSLQQYLEQLEQKAEAEANASWRWRSPSAASSATEGYGRPLKTGSCPN